MDKLYIYSPDESPIAVAPITVAAVYKYTLMGDCCIVIPFEHASYALFPKGSHIYYNKKRFYTKSVTIPEGIDNKSGYKYTITFYAQQHRMEDCIVKWLHGYVTETTFELTTTLRELAQLICDNMNHFLGVDIWKVGSIPSKLENITKNVVFNGENCWDKLSEIVSLFETEWWVVDNGLQADITDGDIVLNFGKLEFGSTENLIEGDIIKKMPHARRGVDDGYGTRFYVFGGTRNIPDDYYANGIGGVTNHISEKRLHLPNGTEYIDAFDDTPISGIKEQHIVLDHIYPKNTETVTGVTTRVVNIDGVKSTYYSVVCNNTAFKPSMIQSSLGAVFTSGSLNGREFGLISDSKNDDDFNKSFEILTQTEGYDDGSISIPNEYLKPEVGDTFILTGVKLPEEYVKNAEAELLLEANDIVAERCGDTNVYECPTNPVFCEKHRKNLQLGQRVKLIGTPFGENGRSSRISGFEKKLYNEYDAIYYVGDNTMYSRLKIVADGIHEVKERNSRLESFQSKNDSKIDYTGGIIENKFQLVNDELKSTTEDLKSIELIAAQASTSSAEAKLLATNAQTTALKASEGLSANEKALFAIDNRLKLVEGNTGSTDISALTLQVTTNTQELKTLNETVIPTLSSRLGQAETKLLTLTETTIPTLSQQVLKIDKRVTNVENTARVVVVTPNQ